MMQPSPLAQRLFSVDGVTGVSEPHFVTVTKEDNVEWDHAKPALLGTIMEHFQSGQEAISGEATRSLQRCPRKRRTNSWSN